MQSETERLTTSGFIRSFLVPNSNIKDAGAREQARFTMLAALITGGVFLLGGLISIFLAPLPGLLLGTFLPIAVLVPAYIFGRSENHQIGSVLLVSGIIGGGLLIGAGVNSDFFSVMVLMSTLVPAFALCLILVPTLATIIIAVVTIIALGAFPFMSIVNTGEGFALYACIIVIEAIFVVASWFRDLTETQQIDEIGSLRGRLEERIEERTRYARIAADIAAEIIAAKSADELYSMTASMITGRFGFLYSAIYLADEIDRTLNLKSAQGPTSERTASAVTKVPFGPPSLLGWVAENKQHHLSSRTVEDSLHLEAEFLPDSQSKIGIPILSKDVLVGVLDVQSTRSSTFDHETIVVLEMLASQIATAIQNVRMLEVERGSVQEVVGVYQSAYQIAQAKNTDEIHQELNSLFSRISFISLYLTPLGEGTKIEVEIPSNRREGFILPESLTVSMTDLEPFVANGIFMGEGNRLSSLPYELVKILRQLDIFSVALVPVESKETITGFLVVGTREKLPLNENEIQPFSYLAGQIAATQDRIHTEEQTGRHVSEMETMTNASAEVINAKTNMEVFDVLKRMFVRASYPILILAAERNTFRIAASAETGNGAEISGLPQTLNLVPKEVVGILGGKPLVEQVSKLSAIYHAQFHPELQKFIQEDSNRLPSLPLDLLNLTETAGFESAAFIPLTITNEIIGLAIVGKRAGSPKELSIEPYSGVFDLVKAAFARIRDEAVVEGRLDEDEVIIQMSQEITSLRDLPTIYKSLHGHVRHTLGDVNFLVAIYQSDTNSISIPYMYEKGLQENETANAIETFPLGEGLTSILIRTKQPLMLVEDLDRRANALGVKITGQAPKSWLGVPLLVSGEVIGAIVVQDPDNEHAFEDNDLRFLNTLSTQVAGAIYNTRLLAETDNRAIQLQTAAEIARDISGSLDLSELLSKATVLIRERFNYYHAAIFLVDPLNEFANIREATGEAGTQMKRAGHKLKVGSKSIVGYVTGSGEPLVVNDTSRDATYFPNPLLPETRAEVGIPLKVGQRILGALDVQSTLPYSFGEEDVSVLRILADQMAIAVINSELFADTQEHLSQHRLLHHVTTAAASGTTLEESLNSATQGLQVTLGGDHVSILLADRETKNLSVKAYAGYSEDIEKLVVPFGEGLTGWVAMHQQPQRVNDVRQDPRYIEVGSNIRSELAIPLTYRGDILGVLNVESDQVGAYNENDEELLGTLGGSLAAIISNARLLEQVRHQVDRERLLYEVTSKIRRSTDMQTIMATTTSELTKALGARRTQIKIEPVEANGESTQGAKSEGGKGAGQ